MKDAGCLAMRLFRKKLGCSGSSQDVQEVARMFRMGAGCSGRGMDIKKGGRMLRNEAGL